ncbi:tyrosine--tRNA ligase [bacterium]|nr:tyrosine--tRNA ligase [bacterium]
MLPLDQQLGIIKRGATAIIEERDLIEKLKRGTPLRVKLGVDPTGADLHLGFSVVLRKLRQFQDLGHHAVLIIGSYTAQLGDPSGRNAARPMLSEDQVMAFAAHYLDQAAVILDRSRLEVRPNGEWFSKMSFMDVIRLLAKTTVARTLEREDFSTRAAGGTPIYLHEMVYPLMQGYDSVAVNADIELGGTDQTFNLMVGRDLQREAGQEPQVCITMPILEGLDGVRKMSKSFGNYVGFAEPPAEMFGKLMSISDDLMWKYYELLTDLPLEEIAALRRGVAAGSHHPMRVKKDLAKRIISFYHSPAAAAEAETAFERVFSNREAPEEMPAVALASLPMKAAEGELDVIALLTGAKLAPSASEARRLVQQGGVSIDDVKVTALRIRMPAVSSFVLRAGKRRFARIVTGNREPS